MRVESIQAFGMKYMPAHQSGDALANVKRTLTDAAEVTAAFDVDRDSKVIMMSGSRWRHSGDLVTVAVEVALIEVWQAVDFDIAIVPATIPKLALG